MAIQTDLKGWGDIWERYGLAAVVLLVLCLFIWKWGLPLVTKLIESLEKDRDAGRQAREQERKDFLMALNNVVMRHEAETANFAKSLDGIRDEMRRSRG
jgi:hypothetical protein